MLSKEFLYGFHLVNAVIYKIMEKNRLKFLLKEAMVLNLRNIARL